MEPGIVLFELKGKAEGLQVGPPTGEQATFVRGDITVRLEIEIIGGRETSDALVSVTTSRGLTDEAYAVFAANFEALAAERERPAEPDSETGVRFLTDREVRWVLEPPEPVLAICEDIRSELNREAGRLIQLLRWFYNQSEPAQPLRRPTLLCSVDGMAWDSTPVRADELYFFGGEDVELTDLGIARIGEIWAAGDVAEPLARQIFLEAVALADENPRAALVLAVAAAEIGVKQFAAGQSSGESEAWLITEIQSPKLLDLLGKYLPFFTTRRTFDGRAIPKHLMTELHKAATARNQVVHKGEADKTYGSEELAQVFVAVNDLLYLLDWFAGNDWVVRHLQDETKSAYPWEES